MSKTYTKTFLMLLAVPAALLALSACEEQRVMNMAPGTYKSKEISTDAKGTTTERSKTTDVEVDEYGNKKATIESETTKDPEGLFNKKTIQKSKKVYQENENQ
jgi:major membrane immunogen (membrane-anchored lipoprotein)